MTLAAHDVRPSLSCRFYEEKFPELHEAVNTNVTEIGEMGAYVKLLEYNNVGGMILLSELSRRRIRSINKLVRVGRDECAVVVRVDREKGYIDLSKRRLSDDEKKRCENKFEKAKHVNSIVKHTADVLEMDTNEELEIFMAATAWELDRRHKKPEEPYKASYDCFKRAVDEPEILDGLAITDVQKDALLRTIRQRLTPQAEKLRAEIEVTCYQYEGVDAIKEALNKGLKFSSELVPIKINLYAPPTYFMTTLTNDTKMGIEVLNEAMEDIKACIEQKGGSFQIKKAPFVDEAVTDFSNAADPANPSSGSETEEGEE